MKKCFYPITLAIIAGFALADSVINNNHSVGEELRVYRLAVAATGEFTAYHGGTQDSALDAIKAIVAEINKVYERELSIRLQLISDTDQKKIIYTSAASDPYSGSRFAQLGQNQTELDLKIGTANYDIGHVFGHALSGGGGGVAFKGVGDSLYKARAVSESPAPVSTSASFVATVLHEIGHQFGAEHTFNANAIGSCIGNREATNAFEPASGSTLMGYAGICDSDNLQLDPDFYFHAVSFEQINDYIIGNAHAAPHSTISSGNTPPIVNAGADYTIPTLTPFELTASASDTTGSPLTYTWEQVDRGAAMGLPLIDNGESPLFRSFPATSTPVRTFPRLSDLLANTTNPGEALPTTNRDLHFRATVRDNHPIAGGLDSDDVVVTVVNTGSSFTLTSPNGSESWMGGSLQTISWNVASTNTSPINTSQVDILLSTDGGLTFPFVLATTPNNGSASIVVPNITTNAARVKVKGSGNIFFDLSDSIFSITADPAIPGVSFTKANPSGAISEDGQTQLYDIALNTDPTGTVVLSVSADDQCEVSTDGLTFTSTVALSFSSSASQPVFVRALDDTLLEGAHTATLSHHINASNSASYPVNSPVNPVAFSVADNESYPVVGVDFDYIAFGATPDNWTSYELAATFSTQTIADLIRDDAAPTTIDLAMKFDLGSLSIGLGTAPASTSTKPRHLPTIDEIDGFNTATLPLTATWTDLVPGQAYGILVMGLDASASLDLDQTITITGASTLPSFNQPLATDGTLEVNDAIGSASSPLHSYEKIAVADSSGEIEVRMVPLGDRLGLAGLALREIVPVPGHFLADLDDGLTFSEGGSQDSYTFGLDTTPSGPVEITVTADMQSEISMNGSDYASFITFTFTTTTPQTIFVRAIDDAIDEVLHESRLSHSVTASADPGRYPISSLVAKVTASIQDNDGFASITASDPSGGEPGEDAAFIISLSSGDVAPAGGLLVNYSISGTSSNGQDYTSLSGTATILAGESNVSIPIEVADDADNELPESVILTLASTSLSSIGIANSPNNMALATITSDEQTALQGWTVAAFALEDLLDPIKEATVWGTTANPDGDSLSNLEEYFHVTSPLSREEDPISSNTIEVGMVEYLEMVFPRRKNPAGVLQIIEEAAVPNTAGWGPATGILESTESVNTSTEEVRIRYPIGTLTRRFLRLRLDTN